MNCLRRWRTFGVLVSASDVPSFSKETERRAGKAGNMAHEVVLEANARGEDEMENELRRFRHG
jgi:hypothetical protein